MNIVDLNMCNVKLSRGTITVKDDAGKTCGMVRGLRRFLDLQPNMQCDFFKEVRASGLWGNPNADMNCLYVDGKSLFYLYNIRADEMYKKYHLNQFEQDAKSYRGRQDLLKSIAEKSNIAVIHCRIV